MLREAKEHLAEAQETYFQHMFHAWKYTVLFCVAALCSFIHALHPGLFQSFSSELCKKILIEVARRKGVKKDNKIPARSNSKQLETTRLK